MAIKIVKFSKNQAEFLRGALLASEYTYEAETFTFSDTEQVYTDLHAAAADGADARTVNAIIKRIGEAPAVATPEMDAEGFVADTADEQLAQVTDISSRAKATAEPKVKGPRQRMSVYLSDADIDMILSTLVTVEPDGAADLIDKLEGARERRAIKRAASVTDAI